MRGRGEEGRALAIQFSLPVDVPLKGEIRLPQLRKRAGEVLREQVQAVPQHADLVPALPLPAHVEVLLRHAPGDAAQGHDGPGDQAGIDQRTQQRDAQHHDQQVGQQPLHGLRRLVYRAHAAHDHQFARFAVRQGDGIADLEVRDLLRIRRLALDLRFQSIALLHGIAGDRHFGVARRQIVLPRDDFRARQGIVKHLASTAGQAHVRARVPCEGVEHRHAVRRSPALQRRREACAPVHQLLLQQRGIADGREIGDGRVGHGAGQGRESKGQQKAAQRQASPTSFQAFQRDSPPL